MGHKTTPLGFRVGITEGWRSRWMADKKNIPGFIVEDYKIRSLIKGKYSGAGVPRIEIERAAGQVRILLFAARPGVIIGRKGVQVDSLRDALEQITGKRVA
ncbi:MAG: KH domain-containing protein, partial [Planctomycetota bacterium]